MPELAGYDLAARNRPARRCGGDYYDAIATGDNWVLLCVADVSGKGIPAALLMSHTQATLRALLGQPHALPALTGHAHALLHGSTGDNKYVTAALLELDPGSGRATYVSAGHINSLLVKRSGNVQPLSSTGAPLGLLPPGLPYDATSVVIEVGDVMVLCSDGVPDAQNVQGEEFGEERLLEIVQAFRHEPAAALVEKIFSAIDDFAGEAPQFDDITLMVLRRLS